MRWRPFCPTQGKRGAYCSVQHSSISVYDKYNSTSHASHRIMMRTTGSHFYLWLSVFNFPIHNSLQIIGYCFFQRCAVALQPFFQIMLFLLGHPEAVNVIILFWIMKKIEKFLREQKPELLHHQKFLENGTAERAKESGTEQNYNMIDGCVNNNPKKPRIIGNRISVLDRLHIKLEERKQKSQPQQQQQQERSWKN